MRTDNASGNNEQLWSSYGNTGVKYRVDLLRLGILCLQVKSTPPLQVQVNSFKLNSREFFVRDRSELSNTQVNKSLTLLKKILFRNTHIPEQGSAIHNKKRREEIFLPILSNTDRNETGYYAYCWLPKGSKLPNNFTGFKRYVTAVCMFGFNLQGLNNVDKWGVIIKHDAKFLGGEKIEIINLDQESFNFYEEALKFELGKMINVIKASCNETKGNVDVIIHLPYYDYLLFIIDLFSKKRLTEEALLDFAKILMDGVIHYKDIIETAFFKTNCNIEIRCPFDCIFENLIYESKTENDFLNGILEKLGISLDDLQADSNLLVLKIVKLLSDNDKNNSNVERSIWRSYLNSKENVSDIETILQLGNANMLTLAGDGIASFETCSILPVTEKQIQVSHEKFCTNKDNVSEKIFYLSLLDQVMGYNFSSILRNTAVPAFYFDPSKAGNLEKLVIEEKIFSVLPENVKMSLNADGNKEIPPVMKRRCSFFQNEGSQKKELNSPISISPQSC